MKLPVVASVSFRKTNFDMVSPPPPRASGLKRGYKLLPQPFHSDSCALSSRVSQQPYFASSCHSTAVFFAGDFGKQKSSTDPLPLLLLDVKRLHTALRRFLHFRPLLFVVFCTPEYFGAQLRVRAPKWQVIV